MMTEAERKLIGQALLDLRDRLESLEQQLPVIHLLDDRPAGDKIKVRVAGGVITLDVDAMRRQCDQMLAERHHLWSAMEEYVHPGRRHDGT